MILFVSDKMERVEILHRGSVSGASVLEKLNETPTQYVRFSDLLRCESKTGPASLTLKINELEKIGYVERGEHGTKITEKGQEALNKYRSIEETIKKFP